MIDNRLKESTPDTNIQTSTFVDVGGLKGMRYRGILQSDLSEYTGTGIDKAVLKLFWYYPAGSPRTKDTIIEVYRPASKWNPDYVSWNNRDKGLLWSNPGGDWYDKTGAIQGSEPYATLTIKGSDLPDNKYYELDVTDLIKEYVSGKCENTGILIKARDEVDNYIAFYSSNYGGENKPVLEIVKTASSLVWLIVVCKSKEDAQEQIQKVKEIVGGRETTIFTQA